MKMQDVSMRIGPLGGPGRIRSGDRRVEPVFKSGTRTGGVKHPKRMIWKAGLSKLKLALSFQSPRVEIKGEGHVHWQDKSACDSRDSNGTTGEIIPNWRSARQNYEFISTGNS
jgi:hypothetical protein